MKQSLFIFFIISSIFINFSFAQETSYNKASEGVIDLHNYNFDKQGIINLDGEWELYWNQLISPENNITKTPKYVSVPALWNDMTFDNVKSTGKGFGTYRLLLLNNTHYKLYALRIGRIETAYKLFINGKEISEQGKVGINKNEMTPKWHPMVHFFETQSDTTEIIIQVSNFYHRKGGISQSMHLGTPAQLNYHQTKNLSIDLFLLGVLLIMALYHLALYVLRRKEPSTLYFALICIFTAMHLVSNGQIFLSTIFPNFNWELLVKTNFIGNYLRFPAFVMFLHSLFKKEISKWFAKSTIIIIIIITIIILFTPAIIYSYTLIPFFAIVLFSIIYLISGLIKAVIRNKKEALYSLIGTFILLIAAVNDILHDSLVIQTAYLVPLGLFMFIFLQAFMLSLRSSNAFNSIEKLSNRLISLDKIKNEFISNTSNNLSHPLHAIMSNVGANSGFLVLNKDNKWLVQAKASTTESKDEDFVNIMVDEELSDIENPIVPNKIIHQVINEQKSIIINDISQNGHLNKDTYLEKFKPFSIICQPLIYRKALKGILYLENREQKNVFHEERQKILDLLSPQLAILIDNAEIFWKLEELNLHLEQKVIERTHEIIQQKEEIETQSNQIEEKNRILVDALNQLTIKNREITDSINYAQHIQKAILPPEKYIKEIIPNSFILFKPKDILSGDFYWVGKYNIQVQSHILQDSQPEYTIAAAVDCTGHGVPGALLSITGYNLLNNVINEFKYTKPSDILDILEKGLRSYLRQEEKDSKSRDGMDISLISYEKHSRILQFAGARNPLYLIRDGEVIIYKGDKKSIGGLDILRRKNIYRSFTNHEIQIQTGDVIYLFSDGFADQFGGPKNRKYGYNHFRELLLEHATKPMEEQKDTLNKTLEDWKGKSLQIDDVIIMGINFD